ncbi:DUF2813 domain-containing protein [Pseudomonas sp. LTJR-52]|uniref:ATP-dependent nuclease n=1 Tax=Pseudomonas sp. LTJR-52 TaxID=2479392 RepID=UPI000EFCE625|nr:AAA family ATPase [Pseudomonas sp. LTJR-52]AYN93433.1 DUF2813 domain-containing protein [Pseudomonas sp. LTJR-52]
MEISKVKLVGYRNYLNTEIKFQSKTLIIGANDCGKTNLIYALRLLLDKSLSENDIEPRETDFNINRNGEQANEIIIDIHFKEINEDAVISTLKGSISNEKTCVIRYKAERSNLQYQIYCGPTDYQLSPLNGRYYLKYLYLKYVKSRRDLEKFVLSEKKQLLKLAQETRTTEQEIHDAKILRKIEKGLTNINQRVRKLNYVTNATSAVNEELLKLSHDLTEYAVHLDSGAIETQQFIDSLKLSASTSGAKISLGGDGRNNQILMALWKAKSQREFDPDSEVVFYCIEEPEAHLHPHQQRKLADYLIKDLPGQTLITSHSPQITARYSPDSIIHIKHSSIGSIAASGGCSKCISIEWDNLGYRMSILPAEAFFAKAVLLVEGPSELLFYTELARALNIDLDYYNISILSVDGVQFEVYTRILEAMEIPWVMRTDNDISNITYQKNELKQLAGINRCLKICKLDPLEHQSLETTVLDIIKTGIWEATSKKINPLGVYLAYVDLETDISYELEKQLLLFSKKTKIEDAINYLQKQKAIRMRSFLAEHSKSLAELKNGYLAEPLLHCIEKAKSESNV